MKRIVAAALAALLLAGAPARAEDAADPVVAQRGAITITASQVRQLIQLADPDTRQRMEREPAFLAQKVRERLLQLLLLNEAKAQKWDQKPDIQARLEQVRQAAIIETFVAAQVPADPAFPTEEQLQKAYDGNKAKLMVPRQYHLAQIFIAAPVTGGVQGDADALRRVNDARNQIVKQKADFGAVAKKLSEDKASAINGGELGWVREDAVLAPVRAVVTGMAEGTVSDPIRSAEGWHLVKLLGTKPAAPATFAEARETLVRALRQERMVQGQRAYVASVMQGEAIQVNEIELGKVVPK